MPKNVEGDVGQVVQLRQRTLLRGLRASGDRVGPRGGARRALRAEARQEECTRAHRHHLRVLRVARCHNALAILRLLLGAKGCAICPTQGVSKCRAPNQHHTNAYMLYVPHW